MKRFMTPEGVGGLAQTNFLGPYTLTRLLEKKVGSLGES
jgi:WW domain-containing oxidoreductase